jgi:twinkle protein
MSNIITDDFDFESYFDEQQVDRAKIRPRRSGSTRWSAASTAKASSRTGFPPAFRRRMGKFDLRPGELSIWAGINGHGKTTLLSHVMLNVMQREQKVCLASLEMKPADTMAKMTRQAAATGNPSTGFIREFAKWTDERLWIYDHLGRLASARALAVATYVRKELGIDHMVIDSLMKCGVGVDDYTAQRDFVDGLCAIARDTGIAHSPRVPHAKGREREERTGASST